jgi:hypothetical protein
MLVLSDFLELLHPDGRTDIGNIKRHNFRKLWYESSVWYDTW